MPRDKKPTKPTKPTKWETAKTSARPCIVWPPPEWPEEVRQAEIKAARELFAEFFASVTDGKPIGPSPSEVVPFRQPKK